MVECQFIALHYRQPDSALMVTSCSRPDGVEAGPIRQMNACLSCRETASRAVTVPTMINMTAQVC